MANDFKSRPAELKPREKMARSPDLASLSNEELLAILLKTGAADCDVMELSSRLISLFRSTRNFIKTAIDWRALEREIEDYNRANPGRRILGVGRVKLFELAAAFELGRRGLTTADDEGLDDGENLPSDVRTVTNAERIFRYALIGRGEQENFLVLPVTARFTPLCDPIFATRGTVSSTPVHPRDVFREAVRWGAHSVIVAHNHPSGDATPSAQDLGLTRRLVEISQLMAIPLLDHIVLATAHDSRPGDFVSIRGAKLVAFSSAAPSRDAAPRQAASPAKGPPP